MEIVSSLKKRKAESSDDDVALVTVTSPERSPERTPERDSVELLIADPKGEGGGGGAEISKLVDTKLSRDKILEVPPKTPRKKRLVASHFARRNMAAKPPAEEIEAFFSEAEKNEHTRFLQKYNYDIEKDMPVEGKYQWILLKH